MSCISSIGTCNCLNELAGDYAFVCQAKWTGWGPFKFIGKSGLECKISDISGFPVGSFPSTRDYVRNFKYDFPDCLTHYLTLTMGIGQKRFRWVHNRYIEARDVFDLTPELNSSDYPSWDYFLNNLIQNTWPIKQVTSLDETYFEYMAQLQAGSLAVIYFELSDPVSYSDVLEDLKKLSDKYLTFSSIQKAAQSKDIFFTRYGFDAFGKDCILEQAGGQSSTLMDGAQGSNSLFFRFPGYSGTSTSVISSASYGLIKPKTDYTLIEQTTHKYWENEDAYYTSRCNDSIVYDKCTEFNSGENTTFFLKPTHGFAQLNIGKCSQ